MLPNDLYFVLIRKQVPIMWLRKRLEVPTTSETHTQDSWCSLVIGQLPAWQQTTMNKQQNLWNVPLQNQEQNVWTGRKAERAPCCCYSFFSAPGRLAVPQALRRGPLCLCMTDAVISAAEAHGAPKRPNKDKKPVLITAETRQRAPLKERKRFIRITETWLLLTTWTWRRLGFPPQGPSGSCATDSSSVVLQSGVT